MIRRARLGALVALFVVLPLVEIYFLVQVGQVIGAWWTLLVVVADGALGALLVKREGARAWRALTHAVAEYRLPHRELLDGALILVGGALLMTPGFVTDAVGVLCLLPFTRPVARRALQRYLAARVVTVAGGPGGPGPRTGRRPGPDSVVQGEVVD